MRFKAFVMPSESNNDKGTDRMAGHPCRHFLGMFPEPRPSCAVGRNVRALAIRCNGGSNLGIGLRLPCTRQSDDADTPLFDCPELDRRSDEEVEVEREATRKQMGRLIAAMPKLQQMKKKMVSNGLSAAVATCPFCDEKNSLKLNVAIGVNNHMRAQCVSCGEGFIE